MLASRNSLFMVHLAPCRHTVTAFLVPPVGAPVPIDSIPVSITAAAVDLDSSSVTHLPRSITAGAPTSFLLRMRDAFSNAVPNNVASEAALRCLQLAMTHDGTASSGIGTTVRLPFAVLPGVDPGSVNVSFSALGSGVLQVLCRGQALLGSPAGDDCAMFYLLGCLYNKEGVFEHAAMPLQLPLSPLPGFVCIEAVLHCLVASTKKST